jgi:hypothetical protein
MGPQRLRAASVPRWWSTIEPLAAKNKFRPKLFFKQVYLTKTNHPDMI